MFPTVMEIKVYIESTTISAARQHSTLEYVLHIYMSTTACIEHCSHTWYDASVLYLHIVDIIQKRINNIMYPNLESRVQSLSRRHSVASLCLFYNYVHS